MADRLFLDTNILIYSISEDPADAMKQAIAEALLTRDDCVLSVQVLHEFFHQATRPTRPNRLSVDEAWTLMTSWRRFPVQDLTSATLDNAYAIHRSARYSWWDCLILAAAKAMGCSAVLSEDMEDGRIIDGMRIIDPFRAGAIPN